MRYRVGVGRVVMSILASGVPVVVAGAASIAALAGLAATIATVSMTDHGAFHESSGSQGLSDATIIYHSESTRRLMANMASAGARYLVDADQAYSFVGVGDGEYVRRSGDRLIGGTPGGVMSIVVKSSNYTAAPNEYVMCDTSSSFWTLTLPSTPVAGDVVGVCDYYGRFDTNPLTIACGGSTVFMGSAANEVLRSKWTSFVLVYTDDTMGWTYMTRRTTDVQEFGSNGTWYKPRGAKFVRIIAKGGGGGGGGGAVGATGTSRYAGSGGGGGGTCIVTVLASDLSNSETVIVGSGGAGGGQGLSGGSGGASSFGSVAYASGGGAGFYSTAGKSGGGGGGFGNGTAAANGSASSSLGANQPELFSEYAKSDYGPGWYSCGGSSVSSQRGYPAEMGGGGGGGGSISAPPANIGGGSIFGGGGGGGGGGVYTSTARDGHAGGATGTPKSGTGAAGGTSGGNGVNGANGTATGLSGGGGGGGGGINSGLAGRGGMGGWPSGGGGGGGAGSISGQGGSGGPGASGVVTVITEF